MTRRDFLWMPVAALALGDARVEVPSRQLHLKIEDANGIPTNFNARQFAFGLQDARVNLITVTAKGSNGYAFHQTATFGAIMAACEDRGIAVNYAYSLTGESHPNPEWLVPGTNQVCLNSPHLDRIVAENREIVSKYRVHGAFFDDFKIPRCDCQWCKRLGLMDVIEHRRTVGRRVQKSLSGLVAGGTVFFNNAWLGRDELSTHFELNADFPSRVRYLRTLGKECVGIANRPVEADCLAFVANGAKVCIADNLANVSYQRIKAVYTKLEAIEKWTQNCRAVADIGVLAEHLTDTLIALHQQFDLLDIESDLALYKLLIVQDPPSQLTPRLEAYVNRGGPLILIGKADSMKKLATVYSATIPVQAQLAEWIQTLLVRPSVIAPNLPSTAQVTMLEQRTQGNLRRIVHVLCDGVLENIQLSVSLPQHPLGVVLIPSEKPLEFKHNEFYTTFVVPRIEGHQAIAFE